MKYRAVIVDDDRVTLTMLEKAVSDAGLDVLTAKDGMKALSLIQTESPDFVISDLLIPKLHGIELCERMRQNPLMNHITIILTSAVYEYSTFKHELENSQADYFITKPLDLPKLIAFLQELVQEKEQEDG